MAFTGVRNSWLILARKRLLAALAASAAAVACRRSSSACFCSVTLRAIVEAPTTFPAESMSGDMVSVYESAGRLSSRAPFGSGQSVLPAQLPEDLRQLVGVIGGY